MSPNQNWTPEFRTGPVFFGSVEKDLQNYVDS